jgi:hypothetical protein
LWYLENRANRFHAGFGGGCANHNPFYFWANFIGAGRSCRFEQQPFEHDCGTKTRHDFNSKLESRRSNNCSQQHIAKYAVAGQHCDADSANCFSCAADSFTDAVHCFSNSECNYDSRRDAGDNYQPMRDAGYQRYGFQLDHGNSWISASGELQYSRNYHGSAGDHESGNDAIDDSEPLSEYDADYESTDSQMNP